jgi:hypothetical protein
MPFLRAPSVSCWHLSLQVKGNTLFARLNKYARYVCAPIAALALWAVLVAVLPAAANAEETPTRTNARANVQDSAVRTAHYVVVAPGDSLWSISERQLGPGATGPQIARGVDRIYALNRDLIGADPDLIFVGQRFALPQSLERHGAGQAPRQAREPAKEAAHAEAPAARTEAARTDRGAGSDSARATDQAARWSGEVFAGRTAKVPVAAHAPVAREGAALPEEAAAPHVPVVRRPAAGATPSSPVPYLGGVRARVSSAITTLMYAVVTDDKYAGRKLLGWALILISSGIGAFSILRAARLIIAEREREKDRLRRAQEAYAAAATLVASPTNPRTRERPPAGMGSVRSEGPGRSEEPAVPTQGEGKGASPAGTPRNAGRSRSRGSSALRTKHHRKNRRREVVGEDPRVPDRRRGWQIGAGLKHSIGELPLRPDAMEHALAELKPRVEEELRAVALVERRRTLSDREHHQANALRDLLALTRHGQKDKR